MTALCQHIWHPMVRKLFAEKVNSISRRVFQILLFKLKDLLLVQLEDRIGQNLGHYWKAVTKLTIKLIQSSVL